MNPYTVRICVQPSSLSLSLSDKARWYNRIRLAKAKVNSVTNKTLGSIVYVYAIRRKGCRVTTHSYTVAALHYFVMKGGEVNV